MRFRSECLRGLSRQNDDARCLIIGEVAQSHDGSLGMAHAFIDAIAEAGADAVKFQTHIAAEESTPSEPWRVKFSRQDETRFDYWKRMEFTEAQWLGLKAHADDRGLLFMSTPFSEMAVDLLARIGMNVWKVASGETGNLPLIKMMAANGGPVIVSSGMSDWAELDAAIAAVNKSGNPVAVLQCTSAYPCPPERVGLNLIAELRERYHIPSGLSDHSGSIFAGLAAVTLGAEVLEIHVALSKQMFGPDVPASVTPDELVQLVKGARQIEKIIASPVNKNAAGNDLGELRKIFTKSVVASRTLAAGTILTAEDLKLKKPGTGIEPQRLGEIIGRATARDIAADELLSFDDFVPVRNGASS